MDQRFRTQQNRLCRNLLGTAVYSDTLFSGTQSVRGVTSVLNCSLRRKDSPEEMLCQPAKADAYIHLNNFC